MSCQTDIDFVGNLKIDLTPLFSMQIARDTMATSKDKPRRVGVLGFGHVGQYLSKEIEASNDLDLAFVWNRTRSAVEGQIPEDKILNDLSDFKTKDVDLIVEVAHPKIVHKFGAKILEHCDLMIGSPTGLSNADTLEAITRAASAHACYIPSGAMWGAEDIRKMADLGTLQALRVTMRKHPSSFKLASPLKEKNEAATEANKREVLYSGPVKDLCPLAPNNVNTMAAAAIAATNLGFNKVQGQLIADPDLHDWHEVEVEAWGPGSIEEGTAFNVRTLRRNPAKVGHVTGSATYASFLSSLKRAKGQHSGIHLC